ncbi:MAG TPA: hypothetical protein VH044_02250, partial [Polyangiaceae bacterium]|nr:hypothetical protein [Polyangiaceae bacterium]
MPARPFVALRFVAPSALAIALALGTQAPACTPAQAPAPASAPTPTPTLASSPASAPAPSLLPTPAEASAFLDDVESNLRRLWSARDRAGWVNENFITDDTEAIAAAGEEATAAYVGDAIQRAKRFEPIRA